MVLCTFFLLHTLPLHVSQFSGIEAAKRMQAKDAKQALLACKCPRCRKGDMFEHTLSNRYYNGKMYKSCPICQQTYEPEPGFYYGAMIVSYMFSTAVSLGVGFVLYFLFNHPALWVYLVVTAAMVAAVWPLMYRYSRSIFLHLFGGIRFDSQYS